jgi:hypothetical protein
MAPHTLQEGTVLAEEVLSSDEVVWCMKSVMGNMKDSVGNVINTIFLVLGHPPMCPEPSCV